MVYKLSYRKQKLQAVFFKQYSLQLLRKNMILLFVVNISEIEDQAIYLWLSQLYNEHILLRLEFEIVG